MCIIFVKYVGSVQTFQNIKLHLSLLWIPDMLLLNLCKNSCFNQICALTRNIPVGICEWKKIKSFPTYKFYKIPTCKSSPIYVLKHISYKVISE